MSSKVWLLLEWVDDRNVSPSYEIVRADTLPYNDTELRTGNVIYITVNNINPRRAKILHMSDSKRNVKEYKVILERRYHQIRNEMQLFMQSIKEVKSDNSLGHQAAAGRRPQQTNFQKYFLKYPIKFDGPGYRTSQIRTSQNTSHSSSILNIMPIPSSSVQNTAKFYCDQATQTEEEIFDEIINREFRNLYRTYRHLKSRINITSNSSMSSFESELFNDEEQDYKDPNSEMDITEHEDQDNATIPDHVQDVGAEQVREEIGGGQSDNNSITVKYTQNPEGVRRMSAQTTDNIETLAPIDTNREQCDNDTTNCDNNKKHT